MNIDRQAILWLNDPLNWTNPDGILARTGEHLWISAAVARLAWSWPGRSGSGWATPAAAAGSWSPWPT